MKAVYYEQFQGPVSVETVKDPIPSEHAVIIKVEASGLCLSDWHGWMGHDADIVLPHVPGHELAGTIVEIGKSVKKWRKDQRVTVPFVGGCGHCEQCDSGNQQVCDNQFQPGFTGWGSWAEYVAIDYADENLVELPNDMDFVSAASLGCRFITAYRAVREQGKLQSDQIIAVHDCGGVGLSAIQIAKALGAQVIAIDLNVETLKLALDLGADFKINSVEEDVIKAVKDLSKGGVHVSLDAIGHKTVFNNSVHSLRKRGKHIQVGLMTEDHAEPAAPMPLILANELEIIGSHGMQAHKYDEMFNLINSANIDFKKMLAGTVSLEEAAKRLPTMNENKSAGIAVINQY